jgi:hypothetical protein
MANVIKLKQSDIEKIVSQVIKEQQEFDDFDTKIQPEELPGAEEHELTLGMDDDGNYYVMSNADGEQPKVIAKTK